LTAAAACGGFAAERPPAGYINRQRRTPAHRSSTTARRSSANADSVLLTAELNLFGISLWLRYSNSYFIRKMYSDYTSQVRGYAYKLPVKVISEFGLRKLRKSVYFCLSYLA